MSSLPGNPSHQYPKKPKPSTPKVLSSDKPANRNMCDAPIASIPTPKFCSSAVLNTPPDFNTPPVPKKPPASMEVERLAICSADRRRLFSPPDTGTKRPLLTLSSLPGNQSHQCPKKPKPSTPNPETAICVMVPLLPSPRPNFARVRFSILHLVSILCLFPRRHLRRWRSSVSPSPLLTVGALFPARYGHQTPPTYPVEFTWQSVPSLSEETQTIHPEPANRNMCDGPIAPIPTPKFCSSAVQSPSTTIPPDLNTLPVSKKSPALMEVERLPISSADCRSLISRMTRTSHPLESHPLDHEVEVE